MDLQDKKVVVLGGTSGIGFAVARAALAQNAKVVVSSSGEDRVQAAVAKLGSQVSGHVVNLNDASSIDELFTKIGKIDHLVYTAGDSLQLGELAHTDLNTARQAFEVRVFGAMAAVKAAVPNMSRDGSIVLTSGTAGMRPTQKGLTIAAGICGAMESLARALAMELAPIRVNIVSPGFTRTALWSGIPEDQREALFQTVGEGLLVGRIGEADDIAKAYIHLMSNSFVTGQTSIIDGGGVLV